MAATRTAPATSPARSARPCSPTWPYRRTASGSPPRHWIEYGRVDVLVNNAGFGYSGPLKAMSVDTIRRLVEVDLVAAIELTRDLLPGMIEHKRGAICFVTSIAGRTGVAGEAVYSATKAGLDAFAESLRGETAGSGVNMTCWWLPEQS